MGSIEDMAYDPPWLELWTYILRFHEVLVLDDLGCHLLCPNQIVRLNDVEVNECSRVSVKGTRQQDAHDYRPRQASPCNPTAC
jgi:hypothetical protein